MNQEDFHTLNDILLSFDSIERKGFYDYEVVEAINKLPENVINSCEAQNEILAFSFSENAESYWGTFYGPKFTWKRNFCPKLSQVVPSMSQAQLTKSAISLIALSESPSLPISTLMEKAGEANRSRFRTNILSPLIGSQLVEPTQKASPNSPKQEYVLTAKGKDLINGTND